MNASPAFFSELVLLAERIVSESGNREGFDAERWVAEWVELPHPALGDKRPAELASTDNGRALVRNLLAQQQSSVYV